MRAHHRLSFAAIALLACLAGPRAFAQARSQSESKPDTKTNHTAIQYEIRGIVVNALGGSPVPHCHLTPSLTVQGALNRRQLPSPVGVFDSDEHGRFSISVPSAGMWRLTASARGFVTQAYEEHENFWSAVVLTAASPSAELRFRLSPEASIAGMVVDEAGEAVRDAQVSLQLVPPPTPGGPQAIGETRGFAQTDDRGRYEFDNLNPGSYRVRVQARPWYASMSQPRGTPENAAVPDPSLDFAYPVTWFPGVDDPEQAETLQMHAGDTREADFHLAPIPSIHLKIMPPPGSNTTGNVASGFPMVERVSPDAGRSFVPATVQTDMQGQIDIGGLTPGRYEISLRGQDQDGHSTLVDVTANSARTIDLNGPAHDEARITLHFDGADDVNPEPGLQRGGQVQVNLIDLANRARFSSGGRFDGRMYGGLSNNSASSNAGRHEISRDTGGERTIEVPPGRYEVVLQGNPDLFLTGLSAKGAEVAGRTVTVAAGDSTLLIHLASGRASISGMATLQGQPAVGAMVLLVPITIEETGSITVLRRDQTNTDGSFDLEDVIPGQYILVAIDHGWNINWGDPSTLRRYLMQGVPVELKSSARVKQNIGAQTP